MVLEGPLLSCLVQGQTIMFTGSSVQGCPGHTCQDTPLLPVRTNIKSKDTGPSDIPSPAHLPANTEVPGKPLVSMNLESEHLGLCDQALSLFWPLKKT